MGPLRQRLGNPRSATQAVRRRAGRGNLDEWDAGARRFPFRNVEEFPPALFRNRPVQASLSLAHAEQVPDLQHFHRNEIADAGNPVREAVQFPPPCLCRPLMGPRTRCSSRNRLGQTTGLNAGREAVATGAARPRQPSIPVQGLLMTVSQSAPQSRDGEGNPIASGQVAGLCVEQPCIGSRRGSMVPAEYGWWLAAFWLNWRGLRPIPARDWRLEQGASIFLWVNLLGFGRKFRGFRRAVEFDGWRSTPECRT